MQPSVVPDTTFTVMDWDVAWGRHGRVAREQSRALGSC